MRVIVAVLLFGEAGLTAVWLSGLLPLVGVYGPPVLILAGVRAGVAAAQFAAGLMWLRDLPPALMFTRWSLLTSASILTLELGAGLSPTSIFPAYRWPVVAAYWGYAVAISLVATFTTRSPEQRRIP